MPFLRHFCHSFIQIMFKSLRYFFRNVDDDERMREEWKFIRRDMTKKRKKTLL